MAKGFAGSTLDLLERAPGLGPALRTVEQRLFLRHAARVRQAAGEAAFAATKGVISAGLFKGMKLDPRISWGADQYSVITGQYELELQPIIRHALDAGYPAYLDIGCANGLYAVGMAFASKAARVIGFDIDPQAIAITRANVLLNGVSDRVEVRGEASAATLGELVCDAGGAFLLADIEGGEVRLIDPVACPALLRTDLLIEVHGDTVAVAELLLKRFAETHSGMLVERKGRTPFREEYVNVAFEDQAWAAVSEGRDFIRRNWLLLWRKDSDVFGLLAESLAEHGAATRV